MFHDTLLEGWGGGGSDDMRFLLFGYEAALVHSGKRPASSSEAQCMILQVLSA
jgi:hypothetical protein